MLERLRLDGPPRRVAIVTGGSRGLGREMARSLGLAGAEVCIASRTVSQLEGTATYLSDAIGRPVLAIPTDVQDSAQVDALVARTVAHFGRLDIMVNNAGVGDRRGAGANLYNLEDADWHDTISVNLYSTFYGARAAARQFRAQGEGGVILNISSGTATRAYPPGFAYGAAKAGVIAFTKSLATMLAGENIRANCILPGFLAQAPAQSPEEAEARLARGRFNTARRLGEAWEMGPLAVFLCSEASSYITGESFAIDGGGLAGGIAPTGFVPGEEARA